MTVGQRIRELRIERGITQWQLNCALWSSYRRWNCGGRTSDWERGKVRVATKTLPRIAAALGVTLAELLEGVTE